MSLSLFVLALYIFLQSAGSLGWFLVDPKFLGFVGIAFVVIVVIEALFYVRTGRFLVNHRA